MPFWFPRRPRPRPLREPRGARSSGFCCSDFCCSGAGARASAETGASVSAGASALAGEAVDADSGAVLFEDKPDAPGYPASTLKLMTLLVIQEKIDAGQVKLGDTVKVSVAACKTGGSQVYLDPKETFSVEELLYAMMIQSANDAAVAAYSRLDSGSGSKMPKGPHFT